MHTLDWTILIAYFFVMVAIGVYSHRQIGGVGDFFTAGGRMPWWLAGISHHMSGYSAVVFVAFSAVAYSQGFNAYIWAFGTIGVGVGIGAFLFAARWNRLRSKHGVASPLEYLAARYNIPTQQVMAWSGAILKVFDVASKWAAISIILNVFAGVPMTVGIIITGIVTLAYCTIGGLWADALTELGQFIIQMIAGVAMLIAVMVRLDGFATLWTIWDKLPASHSSPISSEYTTIFVLAYILIKTLEYNGGMWNLAQRYMAAPSGTQARKSAMLSSALYLIWPLVLLFPAWAGPLILPGIPVGQADHAYAQLATELLPAGLLGLVLAGFFSHTMAMASSDANAISSVVTRDILPVLWRGARGMSERQGLRVARISTITFVACSMLIATQSDALGGVLGIVVAWVAALIGPISIPLLLGMLPRFRRCGPTAALVSWAAGLIVYGVVKYGLTDASDTLTVASPVLTSLVLFTAIGLLKPENTAQTDALVDSLRHDEDTTATAPGTTAH